MLADFYIKDYGYDVLNEEEYRSKVQYVLKHSIKNAITFSRGSEHEEYVHAYEGIAELIRNAVKSKEILKIAYEKRIADEAREKIKEEKNKEKNRKLYKVLALISFFIFFFGMFIFDSFTGVPFILFIIFSIMASRK